jgi:hypothetical protein
VKADRRPPTADRRPPTADRRPPTADRRPPTADRRAPGEAAAQTEGGEGLLAWDDAGVV